MSTSFLFSSKANAIKAYLTEPTKEFKDEEQKVIDFNTSQSVIRQRWDAVLEKFSSTESSELLEGYLNDLTQFLQVNGDIPVGVKKAALVKTCRKKKFISGRKIQNYWTTKVVIAYQRLIQEFNRKVSPDNKV